MIKKSNIFYLTALIFIVIVNLSGCGYLISSSKSNTNGQTSSNTNISDKDLAFKAKSQILTANNFEFEISINNLGSHANTGSGQKSSMLYDFNGKIFSNKDVQKEYIKTSNFLNKSTVPITQGYTLNNKGNISVYLDRPDGWHSSDTSDYYQALEYQLNMAKSLFSDLDNSSEITDMGEETVDGFKTEKLEIVLPKNAWKDAFDATFGGDTKDLLGSNGVNIDNIINSLDGLKMICNIDKKTFYPVRISTDLTEGMEKVESAITAAHPPESEYTLTATSAVAVSGNTINSASGNSVVPSSSTPMSFGIILNEQIVMDMKSFGKVTDFQIPDEALKSK